MRLCPHAFVPPLSAMPCEQAPVQAKPLSEEQPESPKTIYERIGGHEPIEATIRIFYKKAYSDPRIRDWFRDVHEDNVPKKLESFMVIGFGGPDRYEGMCLREAHQGLVDRGLCDKDFDVVMELFLQTMEEMDIAADVIADVEKYLESTRNDVLCR
ncbi:hypothetical protein BSKO_03238 [Bryopsis sp. KO-2023]|nr:hypothetical protein BSKO_03238 [Bryopsis sp. KO-2023]